MTSHPLITMHNIVKRFGNILANDQVNFSLQSGEIHAIVGENGSGKSTLMKILYGLHQPDEGEIHYRGKRIDIDTARTAIQLGIGMVQQHFTLIPALTVLENIVLAKEPHRFKLFLDYPKSRRDINALSAQLGFNLDSDATVASLPIGRQQYTEILKALYHGGELLILDEPTALLAPQEVAGLFDCLRGLKRDNKSIILITHKLREVMEIADSITVMRNGKSIASVPKAETDIAQLSQLMIGEHFVPSSPPSSVEHGAGRSGSPMLSLKNVTLRAKNGHRLLDEIELEIFGGEIVGIAGVSGNGQRELIEALTGMRKIDGGDIMLNGRSIANCSSAEIRRLCVAHLPADRHLHGISLLDSIDENLIIGHHNRAPFCQHGLLSRKAIRDFASEAVEKYEIRLSRLHASISTLSGGNQQKVVIARELESHPDLIIAAHPTRGLDINATAFVHQQLLNARNRSKAVLLVSTDLDELSSLSDRIAVMYNGSIVGVVQRAEMNEAKLGALMAGTAVDHSS